MFPTHPETVCSLSAFDYQQRLREAARERIAASAQVEEPSPLARVQTTLLAAASRFRTALMRLIGTSRAPAPRPLADSQARSAGQPI